MDKNNEGFPFFDIIVVGAGWSGLMASKYCLGEGLKTLVLEGRDSIGGVWSFTRDCRYGGVMTTTETTSSRCVTEMSDFPMPETYPEFPSHVHILACPYYTRLSGPIRRIVGASGERMRGGGPLWSPVRGLHQSL